MFSTLTTSIRRNKKLGYVGSIDCSFRWKINHDATVDVKIRSLKGERGSNRGFSTQFLDNDKEKKGPKAHTRLVTPGNGGPIL